MTKIRATAADRRLSTYAPTHERKLFDKECVFCLTQYEIYGPRCLMPPHEAAEDCKNGKRPHCTCDVCW